MKYKVWTEIRGGVTGARGAYMKSNGRELEFDTQEEAEAYIVECKAARSPHATFEQRYHVEACDGAGRTVAQIMEDPRTFEELRDALRHNVAVRAIAPTDTLEEAREKLRTRELIARYVGGRR